MKCKQKIENKLWCWLENSLQSVYGIQCCQSNKWKKNSGIICIKVAIFKEKKIEVHERFMNCKSW